MQPDYKRRRPIYVIGPSIAYIPLTRGYYAIVDCDDAEWLSQSWWQVHAPKDKQSQYAHRAPVDGIRKMHQLLLPPKDGLVPDHRNREGLHNFRGNLRYATCTQNQINQGVKKNNKSGVSGVRERYPGGWDSRIRVHKKTILLGMHPSFELAVAARKAAEREYFGEFAP